MKHSEQIDEWAKAMHKVQSTIEPAKQTGMNPGYMKVNPDTGRKEPSRFSTYDDIFDVLREPCKEHGLCWSIGGEVSDGDVVNGTITIFHTSGQWVQHQLSMPLTRAGGPQGVAGAMTYLKRVAVAAAFGVATEDDDGNQAQKAHKEGKRDPIPTQVPVEQVLREIEHADDRASLEAVYNRAVRPRAEGDEKNQLIKAMQAKMEIIEANPIA